MELRERLRASYWTRDARHNGRSADKLRPSLIGTILPRSLPATMKPIQILHEVCSIPTAPFVERDVAEYVNAFVRARKRLNLSRDGFGNSLIELRGRSRTGGR
jgi:hypothetical protein